MIIFEAEPKDTDWVKSEFSGKLSLIKSPEGTLHFTLAIEGVERWRHELYFDFDYSMATPSFHFFEGDDHWIGIAFDSEKEAADFYKLVVKESLQMTLNRQKTKQSYVQDDDSDAATMPTKAAPKIAAVKMPFAEVITSRSLDEVFDAEDSTDTISMRSSDSNLSMSSSKKERKKEKKSLLSLFKRDTRKKKDSLSIEDVSGPMDFKHLAHIGFNPVTRRFDVNNIPPEWQSMFSKAGVTNKDLEDPQTANFIAGFVAEQRNVIAAPPYEGSTPPPLPQKKSQPKPRGEEAERTPQAAPMAPPPPAPPMMPEAQKPNLEASPPANDSRAQLMASIRGAGLGMLKAAPKIEEKSIATTSTGSSTGAASSDTPGCSSARPGGDMASMLAAALAQRKKQQQEN